jgi:hypothetical protein
VDGIVEKDRTGLGEYEVGVQHLGAHVWKRSLENKFNH